MINELTENNRQLAGRVRELLEQTGTQLVCAESCTAGLVSATLAQWPGISGWLCGGWVVYQTEIKNQWLNIERTLLEDPDIGPVSRQVTGLLTLRALERTPQASLAVAVTGHLGPGAPDHLDGVVFIALAERVVGEEFGLVHPREPQVERMVRLRESEPLSNQIMKEDSGFELRGERMVRAVSHVLQTVHDFLIQKRG